jgi:hypothetical protein
MTQNDGQEGWEVTLDDRIMQSVRKLPESKKAEVLDFAEFLWARIEDIEWSEMSMLSAFRGMEDDEVEYTEDDLKEKYS